MIRTHCLSADDSVIKECKGLFKVTCYTLILLKRGDVHIENSKDSAKVLEMGSTYSILKTVYLNVFIHLFRIYNLYL